MVDALAVFAWAFVAFVFGVIPGAWFIANGNIILGVVIGAAGFALGAGAAEVIVRVLERRP